MERIQAHPNQSPIGRGFLRLLRRDAARWPEVIRGAAQLARGLVEEREAAALYRRLATLVTDVPLRETLEDLRWPGLPRERLERWAAELALPSLIPDLVVRSARFAE